jgi:hypothetical protein
VSCYLKRTPNRHVPVRAKDISSSSKANWGGYVTDNTAIGVKLGNDTSSMSAAEAAYRAMSNVSGSLCQRQGCLRNVRQLPGDCGCR